MIGREESLKTYRGQIKVFHLMGIVAFAALGCRLWYLQVSHGDELARFSEKNRLKKETLFAPRGRILDSEGRVIVDNRVSLDVVMLPQYFPEDDEDALRDLARTVQLDLKTVKAHIAAGKRQAAGLPITIREDVSRDIVAAIEMSMDGMPGVRIEPKLHRHYPFGDNSAQVLGYIGEASPIDLQRVPAHLQTGDLVGKMGIERQYDADLRGQDGSGFIEVDARGRRTQAETSALDFIAEEPPVPGKDLQLTLDMDLQRVAEQEMKNRGFEGSVVAVDPRGGEVRAMINEPSFQPEELAAHRISNDVWSHLIDDQSHPLRNRAVQDVYPPGSTFKPFLALAALAEGRTTPGASTNCAGGMKFGKRVFHCWHSHGQVDLVSAIRVSCDVFFYQLGLRLGVDLIEKYAKLFGLGERDGIDLPGEQHGTIPGTEWKLKNYHEAWQTGETLSVSIGQGYVAVTPAQMAAAYSAIGNGGKLYRLTVVKKPSELVREIPLPSEVYKTVKRGLFEVVNDPHGTAFHSAHSDIVPISGKTGTAQVRQFANMGHVSCESLPREQRHHGWFVGFAPPENPQLAVAVVVEHGCHGSANAVAKAVFEAYFKRNLPGVIAQSHTDTPPSVGEDSSLRSEAETAPW